MTSNISKETMEKEVREVRKNVRKLQDDMEETLAVLYCRWQDEQEYEDFADYAEAMKTKLAELRPDFVWVGATKRPFGFKFIFGFWAIHMSVSMESISWRGKRI